MRLPFLPAMLAIGMMLAGCASLPVRDFRPDYERAASRSVKIEGYAPFVVFELKEQRRLQVRLNLLAQAFGWANDPLVLMGVSDGIPPRAAHEAAARQYLAETGRPACTVTVTAVSPSGREFEFSYRCG
jgi:hypothetical protein